MTPPLRVQIEVSGEGRRNLSDTQRQARIATRLGQALRELADEGTIADGYTLGTVAGRSQPPIPDARPRP